MFAYYVHDLSPFLFRFPDGPGLRWYGLSYVAAFVVGFLLYRHLSRKGYADLRPQLVGDFMTWWVVLGTLIGGRLGYMLFYQPEVFLQNPLEFFKVWEGGMSAHGGMLGLVISTLLFAWKHHIPWRNLGDNLVVVAPVGIFFGRCANFINGELFGRAASVPWAVQFPKEIHSDPALAQRAVLEAAPIFGKIPTPSQLIEATSESSRVQEIFASLLTPRHPSQLYEAALEGLLLFVILWWMRTRLRLYNGVLTGCFFIFYAILRSFAEFFREPDAALTGILTRGQLLSIFLLLLGIGFVVSALIKPSYPAAFEKTWRRAAGGGSGKSL